MLAELRAGPWQPAGLSARASLYCAGLAAGAAFSVLFVGGALWTMLGAALAAVLLGSLGGYRALLFFPTTAVYALLAAYGPAALYPAGWGRLPTTIGADLYAAAGILYARPAPYDPTPGLLLVLTPAAMLVVGFSTYLAVCGNAPVISVAVMGSTLGVLSTISFEEGAGPFFAVFLAAAILLLFFSGNGGRVGRSAFATGAFLVALVLLLPRSPLAEAAIRPAIVDWQEIGFSVSKAAGEAVGRPAGKPRLAVQADVGEYLNGAREAELFRVQSPEPLFWRGGTLDRFDGARWESTARPETDYGGEVAPGIQTRRVEQRVRVTGASTDLVFGGYGITGVFGVDAGRRSDGSWVSDGPLREGSGYRVVSEVPQPTEAQLREAGTAYPDAVRERFLQLPDDVPEEVGETAQKIRADYDTDTPYDTASAVERYLLHDGGFTYDLDANYTRADTAIEEFLGDGKMGFCVQFATSMALVAREMGVPSRVVYGATSGEEVAPEKYAVYGKNLHTWVEVYFPGVGWYPFDPTPGFGVPPTMEENAPRSSASPVALARAEPGPYGQAPRDGGQRRIGDAAPEPALRARPAGAYRGEWAIPAPAAFSFGAAGLLLGGVPLLKRALAGRGTTEALYRDAAGRLEDALWPGARAAPQEALTPTERLVGAAKAGGLDPRPFEEFAGAYSEHLYARRPSRDVRRPYDAAVLALAGLPRWRRLLGTFNPTSLLRALHHEFRARVRTARTPTHHEGGPSR